MRIFSNIALIGIDNSSLIHFNNTASSPLYYNNLSEFSQKHADPADMIVIVSKKGENGSSAANSTALTSWIMESPELSQQLQNKTTQEIILLESLPEGEDLGKFVDSLQEKNNIPEKIFSPKATLDYYGGDIELLEDILIAFTQSTEKQFSQLKQQLNADLISDAGKTMHTMKGAIGAFGRSRLFYHCQNLEKSLLNNEVQDKELFISQVNADIEFIKESIRDFLKSSK